MTVYQSTDEADFFKDYKQPKQQPLVPESELPMLVSQMFAGLDDLEDLLHHPDLRSPDNAHIVGSLMGKAIIMRINLNVFFNTKTKHYSERHQPECQQSA
jgi:hypothetical protein